MINILMSHFNLLYILEKKPNFDLLPRLKSVL